MNYREVYAQIMPENKYREERFNIFAHWIGRPLSVLMTMPLIHTKIKPTTVTKCSILSAIIGFLFVAFGMIMPMKVLGWLFFLLWNLLDGVDGNLARCTNQCSDFGDLWDTVAGYTAMVLTFFSAGIAAFYDSERFFFFETYWLLIIGGFSSIASIFPRLVMHKKKSSNLNAAITREFTDKEHFGLKKIVAMNIISPSGFMQVFFLVSIVTHKLDYFSAIYATFNFGIMLLTLNSLLKEDRTGKDMG